MKLLIFSDIHGDIRTLERLMAEDADYYFAAGDLATWSRGLDRCGEVLKPRGDRVYVLPGNHESARQITELCANYGLHDFHQQRITIGEYTVAGLGYSNPTPFNTPGEYTEPELAAHLEPFAGIRPLVLICHCPPRGTELDRIKDGVHAGSTAVRDFIEHNHPEYFFCGHIHEAAGVTAQLGATLAANVGKRGYLLELKEQ